MSDNIFELPDKRDLAYCLYGPADGLPVLYFHGTPSSRLEPSLLTGYNIDIDRLLLKYKLQLIAIDRPGMGLSTYNPKASFVSFADDVHLLLWHLKIKQCKVLCWSGGGPFALAIANAYKEVIVGVYIIAGFTLSFGAPQVFKKMNANKFYFAAAKYIPGALKLILKLLAGKAPTTRIRKIISTLHAVDSKLMANVKKLKLVSATTLQEACHQGSRGAVQEAQLYFKDYGFKLNEISQPVHFWWGDEDIAVIRLHAQAVEQQVQNHVMHYKQNEGHLSIYVNCFEEVLKTITT